VSVQLEALADEVFDAAAAQARAAGRAVRRSFGEAISNPAYPDLAFVNIIQDLVAPDWTVEDLERAVSEELVGARRFRLNSRDAGTIASVGPRLGRAWYAIEARFAMVQVRDPEPRPRLSPLVTCVENAATWAAFDALIRFYTARHNWTEAATLQLLDLCHWRATNSAHHYYLATEGRRAIDYLGLFQHGTTGYLHTQFTETGADAALTLAVIEQAHAMGCQRVVLECSRESRTSAWLLGFRVVGEQQLWTNPPST
jgi:hypothetical protein